MSSVDLESLVLDQRDTIKQLQEMVMALSARIPAAPEPVPEPGKYYEFPRIVYKAGHKKGQIDHPGNLTKKVETERQLEKALADGWQKEPHPAPVVPDPDLEPEKKPEAKAGKK